MKMQLLALYLLFCCFCSSSYAAVILQYHHISDSTPPSISQPGQYYWYSKPWFILKESGAWYPL